MTDHALPHRISDDAFAEWAERLGAAGFGAEHVRWLHHLTPVQRALAVTYLPTALWEGRLRQPTEAEARPRARLVVRRRLRLVRARVGVVPATIRRRGWRGGVRALIGQR